MNAPIFPLMFGEPMQHDEWHDLNPTATCGDRCEWYAADREREAQESECV